MNRSTKNSMRKIGIMGGTFNPIHNGHLMIAKNAYEQLALDEVRFIPTGNPPHKQYQTITSGTHRLRMIKLAIADVPAFLADDRELRTQSVSYSYLTLEALHAQFPQAQLYFIMGGDSLRDFKTWSHPEKICAHAVLAAAVRDTCDFFHLQMYAEELKQLYHADIRLIRTKNLSVASSELRRQAAAGNTLKDQVPDRVYEYILKNGLYQEEI